MQRRPDLQIGFLRGNVNTRLAKLDAGEFDAIILRVLVSSVWALMTVLVLQSMKTFCSPRGTGCGWIEYRGG